MAKYQNIINKIRELFGEPVENIPLHSPLFMGNEKLYIGECIDSTFVSSVGKFVNHFEEKIAEYTGSGRAVACVNGTSALHIALKLAGVEKDDEVITQPLTFIATANAISYCGAIPVFVDVDRKTMGLSPDALETFLTSQSVMKGDGCFNNSTGRRIKACVPMHSFGHPCRIDEIAVICKKHKIELIEDAAESLGSFFKGKHTGTFGKIGVLSFNGNKIITTGGGGMLLFNDEATGSKSKTFDHSGKSCSSLEFCA